MLKNLFKNKKGFLEDWASTPFMLLTVLVVIMGFGIFFYTMSNALLNADIVDAEDEALIQHAAYTHIYAMDNFIFFFYIGIMLFVLISSYLVQSNIKFAIIGILYFLLSAWIVPLLAELGLKLMTANEVTQIVSDMMPKTYFIISKMLLIQLVFFLLTAVVFYSKSNVGGSDEAI